MSDSVSETIPIPTRIHADGTQSATTHSTPHADGVGREVHVLPDKVIPVVFLPGIMGSNLRLTRERQESIKKKTNVAWRPEASAEAIAMIFKDPALRQQILDPAATEVDAYDPGAPDADERHRNVSKVAFLYHPAGTEGEADATHRARQRGWSEVFYESYGMLLSTLEARLNRMCSLGEPGPAWTSTLGIDPLAWGAAAGGAALTPDELKRIADAWYPVHAMGYNWLRSNGDSAQVVARRIRALIEHYRAMKFKCEKVIVVTHSMGGLVGRALLHPEYGNAEDVVAGVVHGVMPATGAAATYKRIRVGFEGGGLMGYIFKKVVGDTGPKVTAVLANAPGGLELLPSERYGSDWLKVRLDGCEIPLGKNSGDPYADIYMVQDKWYRLINPEWVNPAKSKTAGLERTMDKLKWARDFHRDIGTHYHPLTYLSYGADQHDDTHFAWGDVVWETGKASFFDGGLAQRLGLESLAIAPLPEQWKSTHDTGEGLVRLEDGMDKQAFRVRILPPAEAGDGTVPKRSAEDPLKQGKTRLGFKQSGYEHQGSYQDQAALASTLYGICKIANEAFTWWES